MTHHTGLPIPDYDHLTVEALTHRIRSLDEAGVQQLLDHEKEHGDRLPIRQVLQARIQQLQDGAEPSGGDPTSATNDESADAPGSVGPITEAGRGPVINPPSHGVPTNPAQPRTWAPGQ